MTATYLDASAAMKLLVDEAGSALLLTELTTADCRLVASSAMRIGVDEVVTYDGQLARAATAAGMRVTAPS